MPDIEIVHKPIGLSSEDATKLLYSIQPHLIRIETRAGHGSGKPTCKNIEEAADVYAFLGHFTGMDGAR